MAILWHLQRQWHRMESCCFLLKRWTALLFVIYTTGDIRLTAKVISNDFCIDLTIYLKDILSVFKSYSRVPFQTATSGRMKILEEMLVQLHASGITSKLYQLFKCWIFFGHSCYKSFLSPRFIYYSKPTV